jgi:hypothetical protein
MAGNSKKAKSKRKPPLEFDGPDVADWILEKYPAQYVAINNDGRAVLAAAPRGEELMAQLHRDQRDPSEYLITYIYPPDTILVV